MGNISDKRRSLLNVGISIIFKVLLLILSFVVRRLLIQTLGNEYNGINSLFLSILGILSIAELGIGTAITFCMYKPIVDGDREKISALFYFLKRVYLVISLIVLILGIVISFSLPFLANDYTISNKKLYLYFYIFLFSSFLSYYSGSKSSLICAYKNNFIAITIYSLCLIIQYILQIISLLVFKSFVLYLISKCIFEVLQYVILTIYCKKKYLYILSCKRQLCDEQRKEVKKSIGSVFLHQISAKIFSSVDNIVISGMFGVVLLGKYSNYFLVLNSMNEVIKLFFTSMTAIIGQYLLKKSKDESFRLYKLFNNINMILAFIFYLGYFAIINELITLCFGENLLIDNLLLWLLCFTYYCQYLRQACSNFKDSAGLFYKDKYIALFAAILNIILSVLFAFLFGAVGVVVATLVLVILIYIPVESYILHKYMFEKKCVYDIIYKYINAIIFLFAMFLIKNFSFNFTNLFYNIIVNGLISVGISFVCLFIIQSFTIKDSIKTLKDSGFFTRRNING